MLRALYYHTRNNHPFIYFFVLLIATSIIITECLTFVAGNTAFFDALGASAFKTRVVAAKETARWHFRAWQHNNVASDLQPERTYGSLRSVNRDNTVNVVLIKNEKYVEQRIKLADTQISDTNALAVIVNLHKSDDVEFDLYDTGELLPYTVVWIDNQPFNLQLITAGIATPDKTPPTNIVDRLFAAYYWKQLTK